VDAGEEVGERSKAVLHIFGIEKRQRPLNAMSAVNSTKDIPARTMPGIRPMVTVVRFGVKLKMEDRGRELVRIVHARERGTSVSV